MGLFYIVFALQLLLQTCQRYIPDSSGGSSPSDTHIYRYSLLPSDIQIYRYSSLTADVQIYGFSLLICATIPRNTMSASKDNAMSANIDTYDSCYHCVFLSDRQYSDIGCGFTDVLFGLYDIAIVLFRILTDFTDS